MPKHNNLEKVKPLTDSEAAYVAGFLDADGSIILQIKKRNGEENRHRYHFHPVVTLANNCITPLKWVKEKCGGFGIIIEQHHKIKKWRTSYVLMFSTSVIRWLMPQITPYLLIKKGQAELISDYCALTEKVRGGSIKTDAWLNNMSKYLVIYGKIKCLNHRIDYGMVFKKSGELLESPESSERYNEIGNGERERLKSFRNWITSSQAYLGCVEYMKRWEGSQTTA